MTRVVPPVATTKTSEGTAAATGLAVLVVDDDAASNERVLAALAKHACRLQIVPNAERALVAVRTFRPRVVVMDLVQPLMSGLLLAEKLKQTQSPELVLFALSGFVGPESARIAREAGFAACALKPIDPSAFARALFAAVEGEA